MKTKTRGASQRRGFLVCEKRVVKSEVLKSKTHDLNAEEGSFREEDEPTKLMGF